MRNRAGKIVVDLNEVRYRATASVDYPIVPSVPQIVANDEFINENETTYALFPYELNDPPIFTKSAYAASTPTSIHVDAYTPQLAGKVMFHDNEGVVKVLAGTSIVLRVEAVQPNVLNVENGVPTLIQKRDRLVYNWTFNGTTLLEEEGFFDIAQEFRDNPTLNDLITVNENELILRNVTDEINGTYICLVTNDIGEVSSEAIELQVVHINKLDNTYFRQNLVKNAFARESTSEWTAIQGAISVQPFALQEAESELKKPSTPLRQHSVNEIYPHPITIGSNGIKNYDLSTLATENSFYFTRAPYAKYADGGRPQSIVYQDIDVSEIQDLIAGRVYGCEGVRAYIGCVIGNSIEYRAMDVLIKSNPNDPKYFYQAAPRLSFENAVLTGVPRFSGEAAYVIVQEFEGNTQLTSRRYVNDSQKAERVASVIIKDPLSLSRDSRDPLYMEKVRRPAYLDIFKATWEGGTSNSAIHLIDHIPNPQNPPDGVDNAWFNQQLYTFTAYNEGTTTLQGRVDPVWWPPDTITETYRQQFEWIGSDPTRILNTYKNVFYAGMYDSDDSNSYKKASYYSYGQYAEYKDDVITVLNPRTTKIRISIVFDSWYFGDTEASYPTLYDEYDRPQAKHFWGYGDPLFEYPIWDVPVSIGVMKSPKILWQTILDNRHFEKIRTIPISTDAGYRQRVQTRRDTIKSYVSRLGRLVANGPFSENTQLQLSSFMDLVQVMSAPNYVSTTSAEQQKKDYVQLGILSTVALDRLRRIRASARIDSNGLNNTGPLSFSNPASPLFNNPGSPLYNFHRSNLSQLMGVLKSLTQDLIRLSADLANYIRKWTPLDLPQSREKRIEAWEEMDVLRYERMGKKEPTSMVTALGLILEPITSGSGDISTFRSSIMRIPTREEDLAQRPKPINVLQTPSAKQFRIVATEKL